MKNSVGNYTRLTEKEVTKVPIFEAGSFKYLPFTTTILLLLPHQLYLPIFAKCCGVHWPITTTDNWNVEARNLATTVFNQHILRTTYLVVNILIRKVPVELCGNLSQHVCLIFFIFLKSSRINHQLWNSFIYLRIKVDHIFTGCDSSFQQIYR